MARHKPKRGRAAKNAKKSQIGDQEDSYKKAPHSIVFHRGHVGKNVRQLIQDTRTVMEPYTATNLRVRKKNVLKDYISIAGLLNVSHLCIFSKSEIATHLKIARLARGPTLTFRIHAYTLAHDVMSALKRPSSVLRQFLHHPLLVMNNFSGEGMHLKLMTTMWQNMFPSINVSKVRLDQIRRVVILNYNPDTKHIDFRHYNIHVAPIGMSRGVKKLIKAKVPDLSRYDDVSEYIMKGGNLSESDGEQDGPHNKVILPQPISSRGNIKSAQSAIRLTEIGPRMTLQLVKIEDGVCDGEVMFHEFLKKTKQEMHVLQQYREKKRQVKETRKRLQEENVKRKKQEHEQRIMDSLNGIKRAEERRAQEKKQKDGSDSEEDPAMADIEHYKQEVGATPDPELFPKGRRKRKLKNAEDALPKKKSKQEILAQRKHQNQEVHRKLLLKKKKKQKKRNLLGKRKQKPVSRQRGRSGRKI